MTEISNANGLLDACFKWFVLGIVQGLTEFLPISSTAHLKVFPIVMGWGDPGISITAVMQLGSIIAVITYFRKDLRNVIKGISLALFNGQWREPSAKIGFAICLGTIPILLAGSAVKIFWTDFESSLLRSIPAIGFISILMAFLMLIAERSGRRYKTLRKTSLSDGLIVGISQIFALIPGVSRSGITLSTSLFIGWERKDAAKFSFLLSIPAIILSGLAEIKNAYGQNLELSFGILPMMIGISSSAIISWLAIDWLLKHLQSHSTWIFIFYRLIFGISLIFWWLVGKVNY
tara:strand:- start:2246 stop:3115 length:870 start_codon:yes stop_codon:yes gene_type:complete